MKDRQAARLTQNGAALYSRSLRLALLPDLKHACRVHRLTANNFLLAVAAVAPSRALSTTMPCSQMWKSVTRLAWSIVGRQRGLEIALALALALLSPMSGEPGKKIRAKTKRVGVNRNVRCQSRGTFLGLCKNQSMACSAFERVSPVGCSSDLMLFHPSVLYNAL